MDLTDATAWAADRTHAVLITLRHDGRAQSSDVVYSRRRRRLRGLGDRRPRQDRQHAPRPRASCCTSPSRRRGPTSPSTAPSSSPTSRPSRVTRPATRCAPTTRPVAGKPHDDWDDYRARDGRREAARSPGSPRPRRSGRPADASRAAQRPDVRRHALNERTLAGRGTTSQGHGCTSGTSSRARRGPAGHRGVGRGQRPARPSSSTTSPRRTSTVAGRGQLAQGLGEEDQPLAREPQPRAAAARRRRRPRAGRGRRPAPGRRRPATRRSARPARPRRRLDRRRARRARRLPRSGPSTSGPSPALGPPLDRAGVARAGRRGTAPAPASRPASG